MKSVDDLSEYECRLILKAEFDEPMTFEEINDWYIYVKNLKYIGFIKFNNVANDSLHGSATLREEIERTHKMKLSKFREAVHESQMLGSKMFERIKNG